MIFPWIQAVWVGRKGDALRHVNGISLYLYWQNYQWGSFHFDNFDHFESVQLKEE